MCHWSAINQPVYYRVFIARSRGPLPFFSRSFVRVYFRAEKRLIGTDFGAADVIIYLLTNEILPSRGKTLSDLWTGSYLRGWNVARGALISVADNMLIMICGDGDFRVNLRKRHEVDPRWKFRVFERRRGVKNTASFLMPNWSGSLIIDVRCRPCVSNLLESSRKLNPAYQAVATSNTFWYFYKHIYFFNIFVIIRKFWF